MCPSCPLPRSGSPPSPRGCGPPGSAIRGGRGSKVSMLTQQLATSWLLQRNSFRGVSLWAGSWCCVLWKGPATGRLIVGWERQPNRKCCSCDALRTLPPCHTGSSSPSLTRTYLYSSMVPGATQITLSDVHMWLGVHLGAGRESGNIRECQRGHCRNHQGWQRSKARTQTRQRQGQQVLWGRGAPEGQGFLQVPPAEAGMVAAQLE